LKSDVHFLCQKKTSVRPVPFEFYDIVITNEPEAHKL